MSRLIEVQNTDALPPTLTVQVGDALWFAATGGRVRRDEDEINEPAEAVQLLGVFLQSVVGTDGQILSPMGPPNNVIFLARRTGRARIDIISGDPWRGEPQTITLDVVVEPNSAKVQQPLKS